MEFKTRRKFYDWPEAQLQYNKAVYDWVVETKGYRPLVIDADDLQRDPGEYCQVCRSVCFMLTHGCQ